MTGLDTWGAIFFGNVSQLRFVKYLSYRRSITKIPVIGRLVYLCRICDITLGTYFKSTAAGEDDFYRGKNIYV